MKRVLVSWDLGDTLDQFNKIKDDPNFNATAVLTDFSKRLEQDQIQPVHFVFTGGYLWQTIPMLTKRLNVLDPSISEKVADTGSGEGIIRGICYSKGDSVWGVVSATTGEELFGSNKEKLLPRILKLAGVSDPNLIVHIDDSSPAKLMMGIDRTAETDLWARNRHIPHQGRGVYDSDSAKETLNKSLVRAEDLVRKLAANPVLEGEKCPYPQAVIDK
jgi:hypothetical protein